MWSDASAKPHDTSWLSRSVPRTVLLVVAEPSVRQLLAEDIRRGGLQVLPAATLTEAARLSGHVIPDALVLDADDAPEVLTGSLPAAAEEAPSLLLASDALVDQAASQAWPAHVHWLRKPFHPRQLVAELLQLLKPPRPAPVRTGGSTLRLGTLEVRRGDPTLRWLADGHWRQIDLPHTEHRLLLALAEAAPRGLNREQLRWRGWGDEPITVRTVDQYVKRLRTRLATVGARDMVRTLRSFGYRLDPEAVPRSLGTSP